MALNKAITSLTNLFTAGRQLNRTQQHIPQQNSTLRSDTNAESVHNDGNDYNDGNDGNDCNDGNDSNDGNNENNIRQENER